jgi:RNA polymerase sigma-70 factor (ECF subfamily)
MSDPAEQFYERVLVLRCQTGDDVAFAELFARYRPRLHYFVRKMLVDSAAVDDLLQEIWLDVFRGLPRLSDVAAFPAWLYRIARNKTWQALRKRRHAEQPLGGEDLADESDPDFSNEDAQRVHAGLDQLPGEQREVLVLRFLEEMSYDAIAQVVGCELGTVRSRIHYAKRALRRALEKESSP